MASNISEDKKRKQIRAYFFPLNEPDKPNNDWLENASLIVLLIIGGGLLLAFLTKDLGLGLISFFGGGLFMAGLAWLDENLGITEKQDKYKQRKDKRDKLLKKWGLTENELSDEPTTAQVDQWLQEDMSRVIDRALDKLGLDADSDLVREPMVIYGPLFWTSPGIPDDELVSAKVKDGTLRFSCYQLVVVLLSKERIATYSADFNFLRNVYLNDKTTEFLYKDIVSVSTAEESTNYSLPNGTTLRRQQVFKLIVPGDTIKVAVNSPEIKDLLGGEVVANDHDKSVRVIREMLRSKTTNTPA